jgi:hypothetical protein
LNRAFAIGLGRAGLIRVDGGLVVGAVAADIAQVDATTSAGVSGVSTGLISSVMANFL